MDAVIFENRQRVDEQTKKKVQIVGRDSVENGNLMSKFFLIP